MAAGLLQISSSLFKHLYFYFLFATLALIIVFFVRSRRFFLQELLRQDPLHLILVFVAFVIAFYLRAHYFRDGITADFFSEQLSVANSFYYYKQAFLCNAGRFSSCLSSGPPIHPNGFAFLIYLFFSVLGNSFSSYILCSALISSLTVFAVYYLALLLFDDPRCGTIAGFIFAFLPEHIKVTDTRPVVAASILFIMLTVIALLLSLRHRKDRGLFFLSLLTLVFCANMRYENLILLFVFLIAYRLYGLPQLRPPAIAACAGISALLSLPLVLMHLNSHDAVVSMFGRQSVFGGAFEKLALNLTAYFRYWSSPSAFSRLLYLPALIGLTVVAAERRYRRTLGLLGAWTALYAVLYLFHKNIGYPRYAMHLFPQYVLLTALGCSLAVKGSAALLAAPLKPAWRPRIRVILLVLAITLTSLCLSGLRRPLGSSVTAEYAGLLEGVCDDDYIITDDTKAMVFLDHNFAFFNYGGYDADFLRSRMQEGAGVYLLEWDGMCEHYRGYQLHCDTFFSDFRFLEVGRSGRYRLLKASSI